MSHAKRHSRLLMLAVAILVLVGSTVAATVASASSSKSSATIKVGTVGSASERVASVTASARNLPALMDWRELLRVSNITCTCPPMRSVRCRAAIGYMSHVDRSHHFEQFA